jgi:hypothetical protein
MVGEELEPLWSQIDHLIRAGGVSSGPRKKNRRRLIPVVSLTLVLPRKCRSESQTSIVKNDRNYQCGKRCFREGVNARQMLGDNEAV